MIIFLILPLTNRRRRRRPHGSPRRPSTLAKRKRLNPLRACIVVVVTWSLFFSSSAKSKLRECRDLTRADVESNSKISKPKFTKVLSKNHDHVPCAFSGPLGHRITSCVRATFKSNSSRPINSFTENYNHQQNKSHSYIKISTKLSFFIPTVRLCELFFGIYDPITTLPRIHICFSLHILNFFISLTFQIIRLPHDHIF